MFKNTFINMLIELICIVCVCVLTVEPKITAKDEENYVIFEEATQISKDDNNINRNVDAVVLGKKPITKHIPCKTIYYVDTTSIDEPKEESTTTPSTELKSQESNTVNSSTIVTEENGLTYAPTPSSVKTYMDYRCITDRTSPQWALIQEKLTVCDDGLLKDEDGYIAVALGSYFGPIGSRWVFQLDTDKEIKAIKTDAKQDIHTKDAQHIYGLNGDIIEFVIYADAMPMCDNGYVYWGNFNNVEAFNGKVVSWYRVD